MKTITGTISKIEQSKLEYYLATIDGMIYKTWSNFPVGSTVQFESTQELVTIEIMGEVVTNYEAWKMELIS